MKARRGPKPLRAILIPVVMVLAATFGLTVATSLSISTPSSPWFASMSRCTNQVVAATVKGGTVSFDLPEACLGEQLSLHLASEGGIAVFPMEAQLSNSVDIGDFAPGGDGVLVTAGTWPLRTEVTFVDPEPEPAGGAPVTCTIPQGECTVTTRLFNYWEAGGVLYYQLYVDMSSTSATAQVWTAVINLSSDELPFLANAVDNHQPGGLINIVSSGCETIPRTITVQGSAAWNQDKVGAGSTAEIDIQGRSTGNGNMLTCP